MSEPIHCPDCGAELAPGQPVSLCPRCGLKGALALGTEEVPSSELPISSLPRSFGDYELLGQLGRGGMGVVYRARQGSLNRLVAVKMLLNPTLSSPAMVRRFEMEAETVARLNHPNIVPIYEVGKEDGQRYFSMKLVEGDSLAQQITRNEFFTPPAGRRHDRTRSVRMQERIARVMAIISHAVHYAHQQGVLHRDLKPGNILIDGAGEPHLTDFGLAKVDTDHTHTSVTGSGTLLGTPAYMAPEQASGGPASVSTDIYSLGVIIYQLLADRLPFRGTTPIETLRRIVEDQPAHPKTINPQTSHDLGVICMKALEKDPLRRYASSGELAADLERWLRHEPVRARPAGVWLRTSRWTRRNRVGTALIAVLCLGLCACLFLLRVVSEQKRAHQVSLNTLRKSISARVSDLPSSPRPFQHFSAEEVKILLGRNPTPTRASTRFTVATFIDLNPMQTLITFGGLVARIEESIQSTKAGSVRLDLRIYKDYAALRDDLASGVVDFASVDGPTCLAAQTLEPAVRGLVCDRRPGLSTVIFVRTDSGITNLAGLKGHSLAIPDTLLNPVAFVFAQLADANLCARDVRCSMLAQVEAEAGAKRIAVRKVGSYGWNNSALPAVLDERSVDAGVAFTRQLNRDSRQWRILVTFYTPDFLWVAGPKVDALVRDAFALALLEFRNPQDLESALIDTDSDGFTYTRATDSYLESIRAAERAQARFEQCLTPGNKDTPPSHSPNKN